MSRRQHRSPWALAGLISVPTTFLLAFLTPVQASASALAYGGDGVPDWIRNVGGVQAFADDIWSRFGGSLNQYDFWGRWAVLCYLGAVVGLWAFHRVAAPSVTGWRLLFATLCIAAVGDVGAYSSLPVISNVGGTIEFFMLPLMLAGVIRYGWVLLRRKLSPRWPGWVLIVSAAAVIPSMGLTGYWPHGFVLPISAGIAVLATATAVGLVMTGEDAPPKLAGEHAQPVLGR
jgi:hypothetical protein